MVENGKNGDRRLEGSDGNWDAYGWGCVVYEQVMNGYAEDGPNLRSVAPSQHHDPVSPSLKTLRGSEREDSFPHLPFYHRERPDESLTKTIDQSSSDKFTPPDAEIDIENTEMHGLRCWIHAREHTMPTLGFRPPSSRILTIRLPKPQYLGLNNYAHNHFAHLPPRRILPSNSRFYPALPIFPPYLRPFPPIAPH
ncbi:hypothetical protein K443DRAFT_11705 [Laccaria amethystina LaAM-08-1]|uniref:Uncharacterized protein n=1 Tax=Laccaria amethystina LaAM-08-1 TaxID=1095629 RepID=A0A0C9X122_9AGAR|nr:hypothetical protein K443DRAFT_11705 [Laccaria amethystina LaAM-08-1]